MQLPSLSTATKTAARPRRRSFFRTLDCLDADPPLLCGCAEGDHECPDR